MEHWMLNPLEFNQVKDLLKEQASTLLGKEKVEEITPSSTYIEVKERLQATQEGIDFLRLKGEMSLGGIRNVLPQVKRSTIGGILSETELLEVSSTISAGRRVKSTVRQVEIEVAELPLLRSLTEGIESLDHLEESLTVSIDEQGFVVDQASPALAKVRRAIAQYRQQVNQTLQQILRNSNYQKMMQEAIITQRYDRYVIPVKQEYRSAFGGLVHDQSASGATLFIEPEAVVQLNNRLREKELEEEREVERILSILTGQVAEVADELMQNLSILAHVDFIFAKARYAYVAKAVCPVLTSNRTLRLKQARHPLIPADEVVPTSIELNDEQHALIITGPNTGGKTVTLKTIGLLALMTQCGFPIPAEEESLMPVFAGIYADIGDEQSIEQSLSTFSGHLTNIIRILKAVEGHSLVLLDELGAGTDPTEGAALAIAILEEIMGQGSTVIATTHYSELKLFAHSHPQALNASVEFDVETLSPTYRLLVGVPGKSNAFAISNRLGLPEWIIQAAKQQLSSDENRLEDMITLLATDRKQAEVDRQEATRLREETEKHYQEWMAKVEAWDEEKAKLKEKARQEARQIVNEATRESEDLLKQLRQWAKERPDQLKEHQLTEAKKRLEAAVPELELPQKQRRGKTHDQIDVGDEVLVLSLGQTGTIVSKKSDHVFQVQIGFLKTKVNRHDLEKKASKPQTKKKAKGLTSITRSKEHVRPELDLRGKLVEEAIGDIDKYVDDAILAGYKQVSLIHGKGTGALRAGIQDFLRSHRNIKSMRLGSQGEGGSGVTVIELS
ncbi:endonuclease MutS2 [Hazenella sp. IB182357]|uniref:Endonuclease MutS2 n=1 Tax=Polycladospora coralii TaxID=2771432 RepID=A0A926N9U9_9BACL|nr:endonuclease MutS2 [Polycladospora coralii]